MAQPVRTPLDDADFVCLVLALMRVAAFDETLDDLLLDRASQADQERRLGLVVETAQRVRGEATRPAAN